MIGFRRFRSQNVRYSDGCDFYGSQVINIQEVIETNLLFCIMKDNNKLQKEEVCYEVLAFSDSVVVEEHTKDPVRRSTAFFIFWDCRISEAFPGSRAQGAAEEVLGPPPVWVGVWASQFRSLACGSYPAGLETAGGCAVLQG